MILSKKFVSDYICVEDNIESIAENMTRVGNEYDYAGKLINATNLVIGEVIECEMHPESDHLHVTKVDVKTEILQIVCGAPNIRKGIKVIVAKNGAVLPGGVIKKSVIRGVESNGMCCSIAELGLDKKFLHEKDIEGIHELPENAPIGEDALKYLELDDEIVDFELTSNRSDLLSMIGMAYELGAIYDKEVLLPNPVYNKVQDNFENEVKFSIDTENVSVFLLGRALNVKIGESPEFIKKRLIACGIRPINNVVDISNYIMLETGQPLHYYDADQVGDFFGVRQAKDNETMVTLDGQTRNLTNKDIVIYDKKEATCLAGVMGGLNTEITENTKNILIEAAIFDSTSIRKTAKKILRSEASSRFEKGIDVKRTYLAMDRSKELLEKYAGATISEYTHVYDKTENNDKVVDVTLNKINSVLGMNLKSDDVINVFRKLKFEVSFDNDLFKVTVPSRRLDISIKEDLIEEVGRIYGVLNIEAKLPTCESKPGKLNSYNRDIKLRLSSLGLNEVITYSLVSDKDILKFNNDNIESIRVLEPMTEERSTLRYSLIPSLLNVYDYNKARNIKDVSIFEIGESFYKNNNEYVEEDRLAILMSGEFLSGINTSINIDFYYVKGIVENLLNYLGYNNRFDFEPINNVNELHPYQSASIIVSGKNVGVIGKVHPSMYKEDIYVVEINLSILNTMKTGKMKFKEISKFPSIKKDLSFVFSKDTDVMAKDVIKVIKNSSNKTLQEVKVYDEYQMENEKSLTFSLIFLDETRTLTEEDVTEVINKVIEAVKLKFNAKLKDK